MADRIQRLYPGHHFLDSHGPDISRVLKQNQALTEHLEDQVQKRTRELHAVLDERKAFFSDLAHNLKAPVVAIHGFTDLILRGNLYLDDDLKEYLDKISSENEELCRRMYVLGDLNAFDKITEPRELIEINGLLSQVSHDNEPEACISGIELRVENWKTRHLSWRRRESCCCFFENLIYNAISFTPEDGVITIPLPGPGRRDDTGKAIQVWGLSLSIFPISLNVLFRTARCLRKQRIGALHCPYHSGRTGQGSIHAESVKGQGSVFTVRLPLAGTVPSYEMIGRMFALYFPQKLSQPADPLINHAAVRVCKVKAHGVGISHIDVKRITGNKRNLFLRALGNSDKALTPSGSVTHRNMPPRGRVYLTVSGKYRSIASVIACACSLYSCLIWSIWAS